MSFYLKITLHFDDPLSMADLTLRREFLIAAQNADGGWGYYPGKASRCETTAYVLLSKVLQEDTRRRALAFLATCRQPDGGYCPGPGIPGSTWVTALAAQCFATLDRPSELASALNWLLQTRGADGQWLQVVLHRVGLLPIDQDPSLQAWPWRPGNNSWVEPTAHALVALQAAKDNPQASKRRQEAVTLLRDRRCLDLGWNYGNKRVLDEVLPSYPETTGIALYGLAEAGGAQAQELAAAQKLFAQAKGAYARAWLARGLKMNKIAVNYQVPVEVHPSRSIALTALEILALSA